jgi:hypothetical protein
MCKCDKSVWCNMTAEEQRLGTKRSEYAFVTIMNKYKKKDVHNYMPRFDDASVLDSHGSKIVRTSGEPREFINLVQNQSFRVMWTKTHVRKLKVKTLVDSGCSKTILTDRSLFLDYTITRRRYSLLVRLFIRLDEALLATYRTVSMF